MPGKCNMSLFFTHPPKTNTAAGAHIASNDGDTKTKQPNIPIGDYLCGTKAYT